MEIPTDRRKWIAQNKESYGLENTELLEVEIFSKTPLFVFNSIRPRILKDVVQSSMSDIRKSVIGHEEPVLNACLYQEKLRLKKFKPSLFTFPRYHRDKKFFGGLRSQLSRSEDLEKRVALLKACVSYYADEIGGHFSQGVYRLATKLVPMGFNYLLNAASVKTFLPWKFKESVQERLIIQGEVEHLRKLSEKGTILLVPTHQSNIDSILIGYVIYLMGLPPFAYGAGLNLFSNPILSFFMSNLGAYTVDRAKGNEIYKSVLKNYSVRLLQEGVHSIFFPGGGRSRSGAIESKLKLGLLGTALEAQVLNLKENKNKPNIYVVPMVMSYDFVLEASSLVGDYLADAGKDRYHPVDDDSGRWTDFLRFFWKFFQGQSSLRIRVGKPLDVFGNFVDEEGKSIGPNGTTIDTAAWLTTRGKLGLEPDRDHEYTRQLGQKLVSRFHAENTVSTSHAVAFAFFEALRKRYPALELFKFLRLSIEQRVLPWESFLEECDQLKAKLMTLRERSQLFLAPEFESAKWEGGVPFWISDGLNNIGVFHGASVLKRSENLIFTEDLELLYYYRNRLAGYGLSVRADPFRRQPGILDEQGFLA